MTPPVRSPSVGVVAIGRNEGERLRRCIASVHGQARTVVYVDSGSTDGSMELARSLGANGVALDMARPFTAARARNQGARRASELAPDLQFIQFVDGDCEVATGWIEKATAFMAAHPELAAVCGRRRERFPEQSIYNRLCDFEWDTPVGPARACGGDVLMRVTALAQVGGYCDALIAGEEPELCVRLRSNGWQVWRLDAEMTLHDAAMTHLGQWWKRNRRAGHAFAEGAWLHGAAPEHHGVAEAVRAILWGALLPTLTAVLALALHPGWWMLLLAYPFQVMRLLWRDDRRDTDRRWRAVYLVMGRFPEAQGVLQYWLNRLRGRRSALIEYK